MSEFKGNKKRTIIAISVLLVLVAAFITIYFTSRPATNAGMKSITVSVIPLEEDEVEHTLTTDREFLSEALLDENIIEGSETEFGLMVTTVDGITANPDKQQWWMITKGGEMTETGVSEIVISDNDHYEFTLVEGWG
jgi:hypothetical protein